MAYKESVLFKEARKRFVEPRRLFQRMEVLCRAPEWPAHPTDGGNDKGELQSFRRSLRTDTCQKDSKTGPSAAEPAYFT